MFIYFIFYAKKIALAEYPLPPHHGIFQFIDPCLKAKPAKYGFLYKSLCDSIRAYTYRSHIYAGRPTLEPTEDYIKGVEETVIQTIGRYAEKNEVKGRNLTTDRSFFFVIIVLLEVKVEILTLTSANSTVPVQFHP